MARLQNPHTQPDFLRMTSIQGAWLFLIPGNTRTEGGAVHADHLCFRDSTDNFAIVGTVLP